jgi:hypothetical protein
MGMLEGVFGKMLDAVEESDFVQPQLWNSSFLFPGQKLSSVVKQEAI